MIDLGNLLRLYIPLIGWVALGLLLGWRLPKAIPVWLGKALYWVGVPLSILGFMRQADLSASVWVAPLIAWCAMLLGIGLAWLWLRFRDPSAKPTQGSFLLSSMVGNTGYLGYPVTLALVGPKYFGWAVFYDTLGSTLGAYGLGVLLAAQFGAGVQKQLWRAILINPALWSFGVGLEFRHVALPPPVEQTLRYIAWSVVALALVLLGMRLSQIHSWQNVRQAAVVLGIKMLLVPLAIGTVLSILGIGGPMHLVMVLQMAMPPAFATLVIAEAYELDRELTVTTLAMGSIALLGMLPLWLWLFARA